MVFVGRGKEYHRMRRNTPEMFHTFTDLKANVISNSSREKGSRNIFWISIPLEPKVGKFVKMELKPEAKWLLLSEIIFESGNLYFAIRKLERLKFNYYFVI